MPWTDLAIETERLRLRAFEDRDKAAIIAMETSADVRRYLGGPNLDPDLPATIAAAVVGERPGVFCVADRDTDAAIGRVSLGDQHGEPEIGYELLPRCWGRGIAAEAVAALLAWTWDTHPHRSVIAVTQTANGPSCRLLRRLGFTFERELEEWGALQSRFRLDRPAER